MNDAEKSRHWGPHGTVGPAFAARLSFEAVSHAYGEIEAVRDVSFELQPGEIICLLGPSGCGKTTLLRIAAGVERPQAGRVLLDGREVAGPSTFRPPEARNVGLMFQDFALFPHLTIIENVAFGLKALSRSQARAEALNALRRVGLENYRDSYPHALSGGEQQRVALARAIVPRPAVMLMDEPFSGLDQRLRDSIRQETLALLKEARASVMLVTHDPVEAMGLADRILLMRAGRLVQGGSPEALYYGPADMGVARFFCDLNEFKGVVQAGKVAVPVGTFDAGALPEGSPAVVLIRPQGLRPALDGEAGVAGHIASARFLGDFAELRVRFEGADEPLLARAAAKPLPRAGDVMAFMVEPEHVLVFPAE